MKQNKISTKKSASLALLCVYISFLQSIPAFAASGDVISVVESEVVESEVVESEVVESEVVESEVVESEVVESEVVESEEFDFDLSEFESDILQSMNIKKEDQKEVIETRTEKQEIIVNNADLSDILVIDIDNTNTPIQILEDSSDTTLVLEESIQEKEMLLSEIEQTKNQKEKEDKKGIIDLITKNDNTIEQEQNNASQDKELQEIKKETALLKNAISKEKFAAKKIQISDNNQDSLSIPAEINLGFHNTDVVTTKGDTKTIQVLVTPPIPDRSRDITAPKVESYNLDTPNQLSLYFSEDLDQSSLESIQFNLTPSSTNSSGATIEKVYTSFYDQEEQSLIIGLQYLDKNTQYTLNISNIQDTSLNYIDPNNNNISFNISEVLNPQPEIQIPQEPETQPTLPETVSEEIEILTLPKTNQEDTDEIEEIPEIPEDNNN
ncbi:MAG: Ig-like domain-containing protein [Patescibacteria group bacterium]|nr:Ig-like domain-containing protein [Patescibacteria group bacterium]